MSDLPDMLHVYIMEAVELKKHVSFTLKLRSRTYIVDNMRVQNVWRAAHMAPSPTLDLCTIACMAAKVIRRVYIATRLRHAKTMRTFMKFIKKKKIKAVL